MPRLSDLTNLTDELVMWLSKMRDRLRDIDDVDSVALDDIHRYLYHSLDRATYVLALTTSSRFEARTTPDRIWENGLRGYQDLVKEWRIDSRVLRMDLRTDEEKFSEFLARFLPLLRGPRSPNRTFIHELLCGVECRIPLLEEIRKLTEQVTMGELQWDDYPKGDGSR